MTYLIIIEFTRAHAERAERALVTAESFLGAIAPGVRSEEMGRFFRARRGEMVVTRLVALRADGEGAATDEHAKALETVLRQTARSAGASGVEARVLAGCAE